MVVQSDRHTPKAWRRRRSSGGARRHRRIPQPSPGDTGKRVATGGSGTGMADIAAGGLVAAAVSFAAGGQLRVLGDGVSIWLSAGAAIFRIPMGFSTALLGAGYLIGIVAGLAMLTGLIIAWGISVPVLTVLHPMPADASAGRLCHQPLVVAGALHRRGRDWRGRCLDAGYAGRADGARPEGDALQDGRHGRAGRRAIAPHGPRPSGILDRGDQPGHGRGIGADFPCLRPAPSATGLTWRLVIYAVIFAFVFGLLVAAACGYMAGPRGIVHQPHFRRGYRGHRTGVAGGYWPSAMATDCCPRKRGGVSAIAVAIFTTSAVIAVASISNDTLQDLKTGWQVGATPRRQQVALMIGCVAGAVVISPILDLLYKAYGFADALPRPGMDPTQALSAPQATPMLAIVRGIFTHQLNWAMIVIGMGIGVALIMVDQILKRTCKVARMPVLAVGIGIYLPPTVSAPLVLGAVLAWLVGRALQRRRSAGRADDDAIAGAERRGVLIASGLIVGESLVGVVMAAVIGASGKDAPLAIVGTSFAPIASWLGLAVFLAVAWPFCAARAGGRDPARRAMAARGPAQG